MVGPGDMPHEVSSSGDGLSREECLALLAAARLGRLGLSIGALPAVLPVSYVLVEGRVCFRTPDSGAVFRASSGRVVAFEVDRYEPEWPSGWSVLVRGVATEIVEPSELELARTRWLETWPRDERRDPYLALPVEVVSGTRSLVGP